MIGCDFFFYNERITDKQFIGIVPFGVLQNDCLWVGRFLSSEVARRRAEAAFDARDKLHLTKDNILVQLLV